MSTDNISANLIVTGGCFWCLEAVFQLLPGVDGVEPGYVFMTHTIDGTEAQESQTRHIGERIEAVRMRWNEQALPLEQLLDLYMSTTSVELVDWSHPDMDFSKVRSALFFEHEHQRQIARARLEIERDRGRTVHTQVFGLVNFSPAAESDHDFYQKHPRDGYSRSIIRPKLKKIMGMLGLSD